MQECCLWIAFLGAKMVQILNKNIGKSTWVKAGGTIPCPWSWMPQAIGISNIFSRWGSIPSWDGDTFPPPSSWGESHSLLKLGDFPLLLSHSCLQPFIPVPPSSAGLEEYLTIQDFTASQSGCREFYFWPMERFFQTFCSLFMTSQLSF